MEEAEEIKNLIEDFNNSYHQSMGIICKTFEQAESLSKELKSSGVHLLTADSTVADTWCYHHYRSSIQGIGI